jgi:hypothetical protein
LEKNLSHCHFVNHKSHIDCLGAKLSLRGKKPVTNRLSYGTAIIVLIIRPRWGETVNAQPKNEIYFPHLITAVT